MGSCIHLASPSPLAAIGVSPCPPSSGPVPVWGDEHAMVCHGVGAFYRWLDYVGWDGHGSQQLTCASDPPGPNRQPPIH